MKTAIFRGAATALVTPFSGESIDYTALDGLIERQIAAGISALIVGGTTGEAPTLTDKEKAALLAFCVKKAAGRVPVIAGTGSADTAHTVRVTKEAKAIGASGALVVAPYYNRPSQEGLYAHFAAVADTGLPVIVYDVPSRTGSVMEIPLRKRLAAHGNVVGIKEAGDSLSLLAATFRECGDDLPVYAGNDASADAVMGLGGIGVISVLSNLYPQAVATLCSKALAGDQDGVRETLRRFIPLIGALFAESNPGPVKFAMALKGYCEKTLRLPLCEVSDGTKARLVCAIEKLDG